VGPYDTSTSADPSTPGLTLLPPVQLDDRKSFLLPQGNSVDVPQLVAVRYGRIPELIVSFPQEGELRLALWELHEIQLLGTKQFQSPQHQSLIENRYRKLLSLSEDTPIPLSDIDSPHDLPLDRDVAMLLGQNFRFVGLGKSLAQDRVFVREKLQDITTKYAYHMCKFLVRVPSSILDGNKELIEMSGPYIHGDFGTKMAVENTNLLLVAVDRIRGLSSDIVHLLQDSSLAHKLATKPELHKAIFVELAERYNLALPNEANLHPGGDHSFDSFKQTLLDQWRQALLCATSSSSENGASLISGSAPPLKLESPNATTASSNVMDESQPVESALKQTPLFNASNSLSMRNAINEATLEQLVSSTTVLEAKPTLFRSVHLQDDFPQELMPENSDPSTVREVLTHTAIPEIMSTIPNRLTAKVAHTVKQLSQAVLMKNYDLIGKPQMQSIEGPEYLRQSQHATSRLETRLSAFGLSMNSFKTALMASSRQMEPSLGATAAQCSSSLSEHLNRSSLYAQPSVEEIAAIVKNIAVRPLVESAQHVWRLSISDVPRKAEMILSSTQSLLSECATVIDIQFPTVGVVPNPEQAARQTKLQEFIRTTNDDCIRHMVRFQDVLNQDVSSLSKDATIKTLQQHILTDPATGRLSHAVDLHAFCPKTANAIFTRFNGIFKTAISHLEALQADVVRALRAVTLAIKTHATVHSAQQQEKEQNKRLSTGLTSDDGPLVTARVEAWNKSTTNRSTSTPTARSRRGSTSSMDAYEGDYHRHNLQQQHEATIQRLAAQNALNWPAAITEDYKTYIQQVHQPRAAEFDDMDSSRIDGMGIPGIVMESESSLMASTTSSAPTSPMGNSESVGMMIDEVPIETSTFGQQEMTAEESQLVSVPEAANQGVGMDGDPSLLAPWAEVKGVYSVLPQEESSVLFNEAIWRQVIANASSSRLYFEALLKNSRITMGKSSSEFFSDANAQFKVLAQQVYGSEATHPIVRLLVCSELLSNPDFYAHLLFQSKGHMMDLQEYVNLMSHEGCRGDNITLCAFANFFGVDLLIFAPPFRQPLLLQSRRSTSQAHLAVVAEHLKATSVAAPFLPNDPHQNKAFCVAMLPDDEFAILQPLKKSRSKDSYQQQMQQQTPMDYQADNEDSEYESPTTSRATSGAPTTAQQKRSRIVQLRRAFDRRKAMETQIEPSSPTGSTFSRGENAYEEFDDSDEYQRGSDDDDDDLVSDSEASQAEIVRAIRSTPSKKRKHSQQTRLEDQTSSSSSMQVTVTENGSVAPRPKVSLNRRIPRTLPTVAEVTGEEGEDVDVALHKRFKRATSEGAGLITIQASSNTMDFGSSSDVNASAIDAKPKSSPLKSTPSAGVTKTMAPYDPILSHRVFLSPSLIDICLRSVVDGIESGTISTLSGQVPEEFLQRALLMLSERKKLNDTTIARVLDPTMSSLMIYGPCAHVTDITMNHIALECPMLKELVLMQCSNITTAGMLSIASRCPLLEHITIKGCAGIGNMAVQEIARKCPHLEFIDISGCPQITDVAVKELFLACPQLSTVIMQHCNQITDEAFVHYIGRNIQVLDMLESEQITNKTLASIARHCGPRLRILKMSGRGISDTGVEALAQSCVELRVLELTHAEHITSSSIVSLWVHCPHLFTLNVAHCRNITDTAFGPKLPLPLSAMMAQDTMQVAEMGIDVSMPSGYPSFSLPSELTKINLAMCLNISDDVLRHIASQCPLVRHLTVSYCEEISDIGIAAVAASCPDLRGLDITKCNKVTNAGIRAIASNCINLKRLIAGNCSQISDESVLALAQSCPLLRDLDLCSTQVSDAALNALGSSCPNIRMIALSDVRSITSFGLSAFANCPQLEVVRLAGCKAIDDDCLLKLSIGCPNVMELDLAHCSTLSPRMLSQALKSWPRLVTLNLRGYTPLRRSNEEPHVTIKHPNLEDLNLSWCKFVDDAMIAEMADGTSSLISLDLGWCTSITANAFHRLAQKCRNLRSLNLRGCTKVGPLSVQYLSAASVVVYR
jgi:F-box/leucine-rich repeat protein 2/20